MFIPIFVNQVENGIGYFVMGENDPFPYPMHINTSNNFENLKELHVDDFNTQIPLILAMRRSDETHPCIKNTFDTLTHLFDHASSHKGE
jgi:hypothetical protein